MRQRRFNIAFGTIMHQVALVGIAFTTLALLAVPLDETPDGLFHIHRTRALSEALSAGVVYPRVFPDFAFGYGYPVFHYYSPLSYYPAAMLHLTGIDLQVAVMLGVALFFALSAVAMYHFLRVWATSYIAFFVTIASMFAPYRFYNLSVRGALPEFAAFAWLPLIGLATYRLLQPEPGRDAEGTSTGNKFGNPGYMVLLVVAWSGLMLSHNLSAMLFALVVGMVLIGLVATSVLRVRTQSLSSEEPWYSSIALRPIYVSALSILGIGLAAFYFLPALLELNWVGIGYSSGAEGYLAHFATWSSLVSQSFPYAYPSAADATVPVPSVVLVVNLGLLLLLLLGRDAKLRSAALISLLVSMFALLMMTETSTSIWNLTSPVLGKLQFPWRWQGVVVFTAVWGAAILLQWLRSLLSRNLVLVLYSIIAISVGASAFYATAALPRADHSIRTEDVTQEDMWAYDASMGQVGATWTGEFLPRWVQEQRWAIGRPPTDVDASPEDSSATSYELLRTGIDAIRPVRSGYIDTVYELRASEPSRLIFHTFHFPAWNVFVDGVQTEAYPISNLGLIAVNTPAGEHEVSLRWVPTLWVTIGWTVSTVSWLLLLMILALVGLRRHPLVYVWLMVGALPVLVWLLPMRTTTPTPIAADFGSVRLEAAEITQAQAGESAEVDLTWYVVSPEQPLSTFVHVVGEDGTVLAQNDGPLAGEYTPFERWLPGLVLTRRHLVSLPADLPSGEYRVLAGVYPSHTHGESLSPLASQSRGAPALLVDEHNRVTLGILKID